MTQLIKVFLLVMAIAVSSLGCVENEVTFFISHVKTPPSGDECTVDIGAPISPSGFVDVAIADEYQGYFHLTNGTMVRGDSTSLRLDSNGILVEGAESTVISASGAAIAGGSEFYQMEGYLEPESSDIFGGIIISRAMMSNIADSMGCYQWSSHTNQENVDRVIELMQQTEGSIWDQAFSDVSSVYVDIKFFGHTQGGKEVETQTFSYYVELCCNCLVSFRDCIGPDETIVTIDNNNTVVVEEISADCKTFCFTTDEAQCSPGIGGGVVNCVDLASTTNWTYGGEDRNCFTYPCFLP